MAAELIMKANQCENISNEINVEVIRIDDKQVDLICNKSRELSGELFDLMLQLTEDNMKQLYEQSDWGWNRKSKLKEFQHILARFLILKLNDKLIGFCHFRFDFGSDNSEACVYCYELQVARQFQRQGLGMHMMNILTMLAIRFKLYRVMLTVFKHNVKAMDFYVNRLKFRVDKSSPSKFNQETDYEILSLKISKRKRQ